MKKSTIILFLGLAGFTVMADNWVVSPILPAIARDLGLNIGAAGLLVTAYMIPFGLFQLVFGPLADRFGKRQIISGTMVFFTIATLLCAFGKGFASLAFFRLLTGVSAAAVMPVSLALIGDVFPLQERQSAIGTFMGISFLGQGLSMAIGGTIAFFINWRGVFGLYAVLAAVSTFLLFTQGKNIPSEKNPKSEFFAPYARLLGNSQSAKTYFIVLLEGMLILGSFSYLGSFIEHIYHYNYLIIGLIMTAFGVLAVVGGRMSGKMAARMGRKKVLLMGLALAAVANFLFYTLGSILITLIIGVGFLGLGFMLAHSTLLTMATEFAAKARGSAMSLVAFCFMGGGGLGTALGGRIIAAKDFSFFYFSYAIGLLILLILAKVLIASSIKEK